MAWIKAWIKHKGIGGNVVLNGDGTRNGQRRSSKRSREAKKKEKKKSSEDASNHLKPYVGPLLFFPQRIHSLRDVWQTMVFWDFRPW